MSGAREHLRGQQQRQEEQRETEEHFQAHFTSETLQVRLRFQVCDLSFTVALDFVVCKLKDI